jgi:hypothetical protein
MTKKYIPLILNHTDISFFKKKISVIEKLFTKSYHLNYQDFFINNGDLSLKKEILHHIYHNNVNCLFIFSHNDNFQLCINFLKKIKKKVKIVFLFMDGFTNTLVHSRYYAIISDATITDSEFAHYYFKSMNINSFFLKETLSSMDFSFDKKLSNKKKKYDISFIGSFLKEGRKELIDFIKKKKLSHYFLDTSKDENKISIKKYQEIIKKTKINLNFSACGNSKYNFFKNLDPFVNHGYHQKHRIIEVGFKGGFVLSEYAFELEKNWNKDEVIFFYNKQDMLKKILYFLQNEKKRDLIANNLFKKCKTKSKINNLNILVNKTFKSLDRKIHPAIFEQKINLSYFKRLELTFLLINILKMIRNLKFKSIIYTLNRFFPLSLINTFYALIDLMRYFYYFHIKK